MRKEYTVKPSIAIIITNINGGGTKRHVDELSDAWKNQGYRVLLIQIVERIVNISILEVNTSIKRVCFFDDKNLENLKKVLKFYEIQLIHVHHLLNAEISFFKLHRELHIPLVVTLHDYYSICPFIKLTNENDEYCGEKGEIACNNCLKTRDFYSKTLNKFVKNIKEWKNIWQTYLQEASLVIVPSDDMKNRIYTYYPNIKVKVFENPEIIDCKGKNRKVGLIGDLSVAKGAKKVKECVSYVAAHQLPFRFIVFGNVQNVRFTKEEKRYILVLGAYEEKKIYKLISSYSIDFFWFPGIWPETYSYTLSVPIRLQLPCLSTDLGAISSRITLHKWGRTYPWRYGASEIVRELQNFPYEQFSNKRFIIKNDSFGDFASYYEPVSIFRENMPDETHLLLNKPILPTFPPIKGFLSNTEYIYLWRLANKRQKLILLKHINITSIVLVIRRKGFRYVIQKVRERILV